MKKEELGKIIDMKMTRRTILSIVNSYFDPIGFSVPFMLKAKILLKNTLEETSDWDTPISDALRPHWAKFFTDMHRLSEFSVPRCIVPENWTGKDAILMISSDGSLEGMGACAHGIFPLKGGGYHGALICAKGKVTPVQRMSVPRAELTGMVMGKRLRESILASSEIPYTTVWHCVDSETTLQYLSKLSTRFNMFESIKLSELNQYGHIQSYRHIPGKQNAADLTTHPTPVEEIIDPNGIWQRGPKFIYELPKEEWPLATEVNKNKGLLPGEKALHNSSAIDKEDKTNTGNNKCSPVDGYPRNKRDNKINRTGAGP